MSELKKRLDDAKRKWVDELPHGTGILHLLVLKGMARPRQQIRS